MEEDTIRSVCDILMETLLTLIPEEISRSRKEHPWVPYPFLQQAHLSDLLVSQYTTKAWLLAKSYHKWHQYAHEQIAML